jgi:hypothetical protein
MKTAQTKLRVNPVPIRSVEYGVYDTQENLWMGNDKGPHAYDDRLVAQVAAQTIEDMLIGTDLGYRFQVRVLPNDTMRFKDEVEAKRTAMESLRRIEGGSQ